MSTMNVICLANSYKHYDRCIAGIESTSGQWIRPVSDLDDGRIPKNDRFIKAEEITLLDRVDIPSTFHNSAEQEGSFPPEVRKLLFLNASARCCKRG